DQREQVGVALLGFQEDHADLLLQAIPGLQRDQADAVLVHRRDPTGKQGVADAGADHAQQREDVVDLHAHIRLEAGLAEYPGTVAVGGETLGEGDEGGVAQVGQIHLRLFGEGRIGGYREKDVVGEQQQLLAVGVDQAVVEGDQDGVQLHVLQLVEQVDVGAEDQVDVELAAAQLEAHDQLRHGL